MLPDGIFSRKPVDSDAAQRSQKTQSQNYYRVLIALATVGSLAFACRSNSRLNSAFGLGLTTALVGLGLKFEYDQMINAVVKP